MNSLDPVRALRGRAAIPLLAAVLFVLVFVVREAFGNPADGLTFFYLLPICLVAIDRGIRAGVAAALLGLVLVAVWDKMDASGLTTLAYVTRATIFIGVGGLCGTMAARLRKAGEESDRYFELSSQMLGIFTFEGRPTRLNRYWSDVLGWSHEHLMAGGLLDLVHPDDVTLAQSKLAMLVRGPAKEELSFVIRAVTEDGGVRHVRVNNTVDLQQRLIYVAAKDVTEHHELEAARHQAEERFRVAFEDSATGMAVVALTAEHSGQIVEANDELSRVLGAPREDLLGMSGIVDFAHPEDTLRLRDEMAGLATGETDVVRSEIRIVRPDHSVCWVHVTSSLLHGDDGKPLFRLSQIMDIDARKRADDQLRHMADHDPLSWLFNRRRFLNELGGELAAGAVRGSRGAVLLIDLDKFKQVNDLSGHAMGDEVIRTVSLALIRRLRSGDVAGRLGGDEFGVLLRRVTGEEAVTVSHDLLEAVSGALAELDDPIARSVTLSIGVVLVDGIESDAGVVLDHADAAMYEAKRDGGDRVALSRASAAGV